MKIVNNTRADTISYNMFLAIRTYCENRDLTFWELTGDTLTVNIVGEGFKDRADDVIGFVGAPSYLLVGENFSLIKYKIREE